MSVLVMPDRTKHQQYLTALTEYMEQQGVKVLRITNDSIIQGRGYTEIIYDDCQVEVLAKDE
tara:strand:- start:52 stop:237 length:186 start_codon:yes stop_codon:yes gene_type:complete